MVVVRVKDGTLLIFVANIYCLVLSPDTSFFTLNDSLSLKLYEIISRLLGFHYVEKHRYKIGLDHE